MVCTRRYQDYNGYVLGCRGVLGYKGASGFTEDVFSHKGKSAAHTRYANITTCEGATTGKRTGMDGSWNNYRAVCG